MGSEVALHLAQKGKKITIVEMLGNIAPDTVQFINQRVLLDRLEKSKVSWVTNTRITEVDTKGIKAIDTLCGESVSYPADTVVLALGLKPASGLAEALKDTTPEVYAIGDCIKARKVKEAIYEGSIIARRI